MSNGVTYRYLHRFAIWAWSFFLRWISQSSYDKFTLSSLIRWSQWSFHGANMKCFIEQSRDVCGLKRVSPFSLHACACPLTFCISEVWEWEPCSKLRADCLLKCSSVIVRGSVWIQLVFTFLSEHPIPDSILFET